MIQHSTTTKETTKEPSPVKIEYGVADLFPRVLIEFFLISAIVHGLNVLGPVFLSTQLGASAAIVGLAGSMLGGGRMASSLPSGICVGWYGPKRVLPIGAFIAMCSVLLAGSTGWIYTLPPVYNATNAINATSTETTTSASASDSNSQAAAQIIYIVSVLGVGFGFGFYFIGQHTFMSTTVATKSRGLAFACTGGTWRIGGIFFPIISGFLGKNLGLRLSILTLAVFPVLAGTLIVICMPSRSVYRSRTDSIDSIVETKKEKEHQKQAQKKKKKRTKKNCCTLAYQFRSKLFRVGTFVALLSIVRSGREILIPLVGLHLKQDIVNISIGSTASYVCGVSMFPLSGFIMDRFGRKVSGSIAVFIFGIGFTLLGSSISFETFIAGCSVMGLGNGLSSGLVMTLGGDLAGVIEKKNRGPFLGVYKLVGDSGSLLGPVIAGSVVSGFGTSVSCFVIVGFAVVTLLWMIIVMPETRPVPSSGVPSDVVNADEVSINKIEVGERNDEEDDIEIVNVVV